MEGIIKYNVDWDNSELISEREFQIINPYRELAYKNNFIGVGSDNIGYGNISFRINKYDEFVISGSATGHLAALERSDYAKIIKFNIEQNYINCVGGTVASSESLSHAAIYSSNKGINAVLHVHNSFIWNTYLNVLPTTLPEAEYGTIKMANSISEITVNQFTTEGIIIMQGHENGVIVYSQNLAGVFNILFNLLA